MLLWQSRGNRESELAHLIPFAKVGAGETAKTVVSPDLRTSTVQFVRRHGRTSAGILPAMPLTFASIALFRESLWLVEKQPAGCRRSQGWRSQRVAVRWDVLSEITLIQDANVSIGIPKRTASAFA